MASFHGTKKQLDNSKQRTTKNVDSWNFNVSFSYFLQSVHILSNYFGTYICFGTCRITASCHYHSCKKNYLNFKIWHLSKNKTQYSKTKQNNVSILKSSYSKMLHWLIMAKFQAVTQNDRQSIKRGTWMSAAWMEKWPAQFLISWHYRFHSD